MVFVSWSGGKDSALCFYRGLREVGRIDAIFTMFDESCERTRAHGLPQDVIKAQAESLGVKMFYGCASWKDYESRFSEFLERYARGGIGIFGDIDLEDHKRWVENICGRYNVKPIEPLWLEDREKLIREFLDLGFKAKIIAVKKDFEVLLGRDLQDPSTIDILKSMDNIDICGEKGEYHTVVYDGPIFRKPIDLRFSEIYEKDGMLYLTVERI